MDDVVQRILAQSPDLVTIGFGMNEYWSPAAQHSDRIEALMDKILAGCPQTEFLLLSSMLPNRMAYSMNNMNLSAFEKSYYQLQADRSDLSIAIAPVNTVYLHAADAKRDLDLMGGNRNHPNDFAVRLYAQTIAASLGVYASPVITAEALVHGSAGTDYAAKLTAIADSDIHWSVTDGDLPEGLTLHPDGRINGDLFLYGKGFHSDQQHYKRILHHNLPGICCGILPHTIVRCSCNRRIPHWYMVWRDTRGIHWRSGTASDFPHKKNSIISPISLRIPLLWNPAFSQPLRAIKSGEAFLLFQHSTSLSMQAKSIKICNPFVIVFSSGPGYNDDE